MALQLLELVDSPSKSSSSEVDAAAHAASSLVAAAAASHPAKLVPRLFEKLDATVASSDEAAVGVRRNALQVYLIVLSLTHSHLTMH